LQGKRRAGPPGRRARPQLMLVLGGSEGDTVDEFKGIKFQASKELDASIERQIYGAPLAARWRRFFASMVDSVIVAMIFIPYFKHTGGFDPRSEYSLGGILDRSVIVLIGFGIWLLLNYYFLNLYSQTIGKWILRIRITRLDGQAATPARVALLRYLPILLVGIVPIIGPLIGAANILYIFRPDKRCIHDLLAGTVVVDYRSSA
jgi:uncharacterized RDD family membrane protein YckC